MSAEPAFTEPRKSKNASRMCRATRPTSPCDCQRLTSRAARPDTVVRMDPKQALLGKLAHIFSDAVVDEAEKSSLRAFLASGELTTKDLREVFDDFVATTWKETMADSHVSDIEKQRLREIVRVLGLDA
ncbi:MAG: hypothetical protein QOI41_3511, partial [Myxococcales bacterium]|nr:hypothetical protein [Myxococcales bacterium]